MKRAVWLLLSFSACTGTGTTARVDDDPMTVEENQQGTGGGEVTGPTYPMTSSPLPDTYIWCATAGGDACARATAALGALPIKNPASAPSQLFVLEDLPDDCTATGVLDIRHRLDSAFSLNAAGWRDQAGPSLDPMYFQDVYTASGCISDSSAPLIKIGVSSSSTPRTYLVRVWETASGY